MTLSNRRIAANRANAKKSTGPKTAAGKAKSSLNSVCHGLCATSLVIETEDVDDYNRFRAEYVTRFGPRDVVEFDLVDRMVHASWNLRRTWTMQNELINLQMFQMRGSLDKEFTSIPKRTRTAFAFEKIAEKPTLALLNRYEARQSSEYQRALKTLLDLRKYVPLAPPGPEMPNEATEPDPPLNQAPPREIPASPGADHRSQAASASHRQPPASRPKESRP